MIYVIFNMKRIYNKILVGWLSEKFDYTIFLSVISSDNRGPTLFSSWETAFFPNEVLNARLICHDKIRWQIVLPIILFRFYIGKPQWELVNARRKRRNFLIQVDGRSSCHATGTLFSPFISSHPNVASLLSTDIFLGHINFCASAAVESTLRQTIACFTVVRLLKFSRGM